MKLEELFPSKNYRASMEEIEKRQKLERNIPVIFIYKALFASMVLLPVIIPFFESRGLDMQDVFLLQSLFGFCLLILEVPSGYIADLLGRRQTLFLASIFWGLGILCFPLAQGFWGLSLGEVLMAISVSLISGTDISIVYDSLQALKSKKAPIKFMGKMIFYQQLGEVVGGLIGGWLVLISINTVAWTNAVIAWLPLAICFFIYEPERALMDKRKHRENALYIYRSVFKHSKLLTLVVLNNMFYGAATLVAVWTFQKYWQNLGIALLLFGYLWAASNLVVALVARSAHKIEKTLGSEKTMILLGLLPIFGYFGMAWGNSTWAILFCFLFQTARGLNAVILRDALNRRVQSDLRATANSIAGLGMRTLFIVLGPLVGFLMDEKGLKTAFLVMGVFYIGVFLFLMLPLLGQRKNFEKIEGSLKRTSPN